MNKLFTYITFFFMFVFTTVISNAIASENGQSPENDPFYDPFEDDTEASSTITEQQSIPDPIEGYNRVIFSFNDKLYFYALKPAAIGYKFIVPAQARQSVKRFFVNLSAPARIINCVLQGKFKVAGNGFSRLVINSTIGIAGFFDPAKKYFNLSHHDEDSAQTIGFHGIRPGFYIVWPFLGPSSLRDTAGTVLDTLLNPLSYAKIKTWERIAIEGYSVLNDTSLKIGDYESLKEMALDPYISARNAYFQHRESEIKK